MKRYTSQNRMFLLELILCFILFTVMLSITLQFFSKSHALSRKSTDLYQACILCSNIADECIASKDGISTLSESYLQSNSIGGQQIIYFDNNYQECSSADYQYRAIVTEHQDAKEARISRITISFCSKDIELYRLETSHYRQTTLDDALSGDDIADTLANEGGDSDE